VLEAFPPVEGRRPCRLEASRIRPGLPRNEWSRMIGVRGAKPGYRPQVWVFCIFCLPYRLLYTSSTPKMAGAYEICLSLRTARTSRRLGLQTASRMRHHPYPLRRDPCGPSRPPTSVPPATVRVRPYRRCPPASVRAACYCPCPCVPARVRPMNRRHSWPPDTGQRAAKVNGL